MKSPRVPPRPAPVVVIKHGRGFACPGGKDIRLAAPTDWVLFRSDGQRLRVIDSSVALMSVACPRPSRPTSSLAGSGG